MKKLSIFLVIGILFFIEGCKKYPEGPLITFRTPLKRVCGKWDVEKFLVNKDDSTATFKAYSCYGPIEFLGCHGLVGKEPVIQVYGGFNGCYISGQWAFFDDYNFLVILSYKVNSIAQNYGPYLAPGEIYWKIHKLTNKKMWLSTNYNSKEYYVEFKSVN